MPDIITVAVLNSKGGVGKTLFATQLAVRACDDFNMVALVDLDPSAGARSWFESRGAQGDMDQPTAFVGVSDPTQAVDTAERAGYEIAFLDGAPNTVDATRKAIEVADIVIIPEKIGKGDTKQSGLVAKLCRDADKPAIVVINDIPPPSARRTYQAERAEIIASEVAEYGLPVIKVINRDAYAQAGDYGLGVHEISGRAATDAKKEIDQLYQAVAEAVSKRV